MGHVRLWHLLWLLAYSVAHHRASEKQWATAVICISARAGLSVQGNLQDGGNTVMFSVAEEMGCFFAVSQSPQEWYFCIVWIDGWVT